MYFVIYKSASSKQPYWWVIKSEGNHATLATSEMYSYKSDCIAAVRKVASEAGDSSYYDRTGE